MANSVEGFGHAVIGSAHAATYGGSGAAVVSGAAAAKEIVYGLTPPEWSFVGVVGGLAIGLVGLLVNVVVNVWYKRQQLKILREQSK